MHPFAPNESNAAGLFALPCECDHRSLKRQPNSLRLEARDDLAGNGLDLLHLVLVRNEDELLRPDREVRLELFDAFVDRSHDGAVLGRLAPSREGPFLRPPLHHLTFDRLPGLADVDRQLRGVEELVWILAGFLGEAADLAPRFCEAFRPVEIGEPAVAGDRRALEDPIDISA